jgi:pyridinium-3,5-biscarboxylic acid mononucleotide sulfurtransferase
MAASRDLGVVLDGTNFDDLSGHRPGRDAAERAAVRSPLAELGFTKEDIRTQSRKLGIKGWDKPASPCLASRVAYGVEVTVDRLAKVERGEDFLRQLGFREFRVRSYQDTARVEIAKRELDNSNLSESWPAIENELRRIGFESVSLDPQGFRSGSMNVGVV